MTLTWIDEPNRSIAPVNGGKFQVARTWETGRYAKQRAWVVMWFGPGKADILNEVRVGYAPTREDGKTKAGKARIISNPHPDAVYAWKKGDLVLYGSVRGIVEAVVDGSSHNYGVRLENGNFKWARPGELKRLPAGEGRGLKNPAKRNPAKKIAYAVRLDSPHHQEHVDVADSGKLATLYRFTSPLINFRITPSQRAKVKAKKGKINVYESQITTRWSR